MKNIFVSIFVMLISLQVRAETIVIDQYLKYKYIGKQCKYHSGTLQEYTLSNWHQLTTNTIKLSPDVWHKIQFNIESRDSFDKSLLLYLHNAQIDSAFYKMYQNNACIYTSPITGCNMSAWARPTNARTMSLPLQFKAKQSFEVILFVYGREFELSVSPELVDPMYENDFEWTDSAYFILFLFIAICLFISCTLIFFLYKYKQKINTFAWFICYAIFGGIHLISTSGYGSLYIWGNYPYFEVNAAIFSGAICCLALIEMARIEIGMFNPFKRCNQVFYYFGRFYVFSSIVGFLHYFPFWPDGYYKVLISISYGGMIVVHAILAYFFLIVKNKAQTKGNFWLGLFYLLHLVFYILIIIIEDNIVAYDHKYHTIVNLIFYIPQMVLVISFLILNYIDIIEKMEKEELILKDKILSNLYNEVSEPLSKIELSLYSKKSMEDNELINIPLSKLKADVQIAHRQLNDLYYAIKPSKIYVSDLYRYLKDWLYEYWKTTNVETNFEYKKNLNDITLDPLVKAQLIFIVKEINTNIAKHAQARNVFFQIQENDLQSFVIIVADDGVGFDTSAKYSGHGMEGIRSRLQKINGKLEIISKPDEGVKYRIEFM